MLLYYAIHISVLIVRVPVRHGFQGSWLRHLFPCCAMTTSIQRAAQGEDESSEFVASERVNRMDGTVTLLYEILDSVDEVFHVSNSLLVVDEPACD